MRTKEIAVVLLAAGLGTRMNSIKPKVLHSIAGRPMILQLLHTVTKMNPDRIVLVIGPDMELVIDAVKEAGYNIEIIIQHDRFGTGHAVQQTERVLSGFKGDVLVLYGDSPLITLDTLKNMLEARSKPNNPAVVVLGFRPFDGGEYGRLILDKNGNLDAIVEVSEASEDEILNNFCNSGVMAFDATILFDLVRRLSNKNVKGEFYLTDVVKIAGSYGRVCSVVEADELELIGINSRTELALAETIMQDRLRESAMKNGATLIDPSSIYFSYDTKIGQDVTIGPNVFFGPGVEICDGVSIKAFSHIEGAFIGDSAIIGPFARLRPGTDICENVRIGNFVEVKNSTLAAGVKANHLSYIGDTKVGQKANIGAGTITCNFDGYRKSFTEIGARAFVGSNTALVAPVKVGDDSIIGAGSVITKDIGDGALAIARAKQKVVDKYINKSRVSKEKK